MYRTEHIKKCTLQMAMGVLKILWPGMWKFTRYEKSDAKLLPQVMRGNISKLKTTLLGPKDKKFVKWQTRITCQHVLEAPQPPQ